MRPGLPDRPGHALCRAFGRAPVRTSRRVPISSGPATQACIGVAIEFLGFDSLDDLILDAGTTEVTGTGSAFDGLSTHKLVYPFANGSDVINGAEVSFLGDQGNAGIQFDNGVFRTVFLSFPFEALPGAPLRQDALSRFFDYCALPHPPGELFFSDGFE